MDTIVIILDVLERNHSFLYGWQCKFLGPLFAGDILIADLGVLFRHQFLLSGAISLCSGLNSRCVS
jgi:hypothetical protein